MAQIFDCDKVTDLTLQWQANKDVETLSLILENTRSLIEAIVSGYDSTMRDDLIQESYMRIQYSLTYFNPKISSLHNYFTTVIHNCCNSYVSKQSRNYGQTTEVPDEIVEAIRGNRCDEPENGDQNLLELIIRNRERFSSIDVGDIDDITTTIYNSLKYTGNKFRLIVSQVSQQFNYEPAVIGIIYNSTLCHIRSKYTGFTSVVDYSGEFNLLPDLKEVLGNDAYQRLVTMFAGMIIKIVC
jgi:hypothetical protein